MILVWIPKRQRGVKKYTLAIFYLSNSMTWTKSNKLIFMTKIRTTEEMINSIAFSKLMQSDKKRVELLLQEYAKQFIDLAAESAEARMRNGHSMAYPEVDKESILKLKERVV